MCINKVYIFICTSRGTYIIGLKCTGSVTQTDLGSNSTCHTPGVWLWASDFTPWCLNFLIMGIMIVLMSESYFKDSGTSVYKEFSMAPYLSCVSG